MLKAVIIAQVIVFLQKLAYAVIWYAAPLLCIIPAGDLRASTPITDLSGAFRLFAWFNINVTGDYVNRITYFNELTRSPSILYINRSGQRTIILQSNPPFRNRIQI